MYLRHTIRKKDVKVHPYWCLVRSVRVGQRLVQQTVAQLGELDEQRRVAARALARRLIGKPEEVRRFDDSPETCVHPLAGPRAIHRNTWRDPFALRHSA
jgi:hypothetical protein